jgi:hypothetical protein
LSNRKEPLESDVIRNLIDIDSAQRELKILADLTDIGIIPELQVITKQLYKTVAKLYIALDEIDSIHQEGGGSSFMRFDERGGLSG